MKILSYNIHRCSQEKIEYEHIYHRNDNRPWRKVSVSVDAPSVSKAEQIAIGMLENGELDCMSQICVEYTITEV